MIVKGRIHKKHDKQQIIHQLVGRNLKETSKHLSRIKWCNKSIFLHQNQFLLHTHNKQDSNSFVKREKEKNTGQNRTEHKCSTHDMNPLMIK